MDSNVIDKQYLLLAGNAVYGAGATEVTVEKNAAWLEKLNFEDNREFENAARGLIEAPESVEIYDAAGNIVWSVDALGDLSGEAPESVNPSLWRNTQLNQYAGLFEVCDGIYQVRGYDMANVTFIRSDNGWIVFDVLMCIENMQAALELMEKHFGEINVKAVLYSHSHVDHFGGVEGLISKEQVADAGLSLEEQLASGKIPVIAPEGFSKYAVSENVYAGTAMGRRAQYQYVSIIEKGIEESMAMGIGIGQGTGSVSMIAPTYEITEETKNLIIDGIEIEFQLTPGTEAPAEMNAYFPQYKALWMAENCTGTLHNLYTLRGAQIRDGSAWAKYIVEADQLYGNKAEVVFQSHNWPHWGDEIHEYLINTASVYKFINDQTLHYMNLGYTSTEIANMIQLPEALEKVWYTRQYYGTLSHNVKAVYQKYLGDVDAVLEKARADFDAGEYQWVAQITKELIYADPENQEARNLCADALEQLGYQVESGAWRNAYLVGAKELRQGNQAMTAKNASGVGKVLIEMTTEMLLDTISIRSNGELAEAGNLSMNLVIADTGEVYHVIRRNGILLYYEGECTEDADATVTCARLQLCAAILGNGTDGIQIEGDVTVLERLLQYVVQFKPTFNVIEP